MVETHKVPTRSLSLQCSPATPSCLFPRVPQYKYDRCWIYLLRRAEAETTWGYTGERRGDHVGTWWDPIQTRCGNSTFTCLCCRYSVFLSLVSGNHHHPHRPFSTNPDFWSLNSYLPNVSTPDEPRRLELASTLRSAMYASQPITGPLA